MPTITTGREAQIRHLLAVRNAAAIDLATMPSWREDTAWARGLAADIDASNRRLAEFGLRD